MLSADYAQSERGAHSKSSKIKGADAQLCTSPFYSLTIWNARRVRFAHNQRKTYFIIRNSGKSADFPELPFHGRGRNGKWQLQRRFLRKRGAGVSGLALSVTCGDRFPLLSLRDIFPRPGEVGPQRGSPWQSTQTSSFCQGLSLWERCHRR